MALSNKGRRWPLLLSVAGLAGIGAAALAQGSAGAAPGAAVYAQHCAMCHGANLEGQLAPALNDAAFRQKWDGKAQALADYIRASMPPGSCGSLSP
jgi:mono/diheme cytochrome c family protein